jgi:hypothetical protein
MAEDTRKRPDFSADYSSHPSHDSASDPLAELARLIGQSDPFTDLSKQSPRKPLTAIRNDDRPAPEWLARPVSQDHEEYDAPAQQPYARPRHDDAQHDPHAPAGYDAENGPAAQAGDYADPAHGYDHYPPDDRYRVALPSGQYDPDSYYAEDGHMPPQGEESVIHRRRGSSARRARSAIGRSSPGPRLRRTRRSSRLIRARRKPFRRLPPPQALIPPSRSRTASRRPRPSAWCRAKSSRYRCRLRRHRQHRA